MTALTHLVTPVAPTDADAIAASLDHPAEFVAVFDRHFESIHAYLQRRVPDSLADDLASETFTRAFDRRSSYDLSRPDAQPWLYGFAVNLLRRHRRAQVRELRAHTRVHGRRDTLVADTEDKRIDAELARPALGAALAALPLADREVLLLFAWAELDYAQIAQALDIPVGTVRSRLNRARRRVRESLAESGLIETEESR